MKKTFLMAAFAALAMVFTTSCNKEDDTEDTGNYPESLQGYWIPVDLNEGGNSYITIGQAISGKAECSVHIEGAPIDIMTGYVTYDAKTGAGAFELDAATARELPTLVVKLQAKDKDLLTVSRSLDGGQHFMSADFKRVEKPDNGGENQGGQQGDTIINRTWPVEPIGHFIGMRDSNYYYAMIGEDSNEVDNIYTIEIWNNDEDGAFEGTITYNAETGAISADLQSLPDRYAQYQALLQSNMITIEFVDEDTFIFRIAAMGRTMIDMTFNRWNPAGK